MTLASVFSRIRSSQLPLAIVTGIVKSDGIVGKLERITAMEYLKPLNMILPTRFPSIQMPPRVKNFPVLPRIISIIEDPRISPSISPPNDNNKDDDIDRSTIRCKNRDKIQRRKHVRKKHRKQRLREMRYVIMKRQNERESVAEAKFRKEQGMTLKKALEFDADKYVRETIGRAKWRPNADTSEAMKIGVFWSEFMTVEQLFGVPDGDYIDKKNGFANDDDWQKILELREKYEKEYRRK